MKVYKITFYFNIYEPVQVTVVAKSDEIAINKGEKALTTKMVRDNVMFEFDSIEDIALK